MSASSGEFASVQPGDDLVIHAGDWNALMEMARDYFHREGRHARPVPPMPEDETNVLIQNTTGADVPRWGVLAVPGRPSQVPVVGPANSQSTFEDRQVVFGLAPWPDADFVITQEPIGAGSIGRAVCLGLTKAQINVSNATHGFVTPSTSTSTLDSSSSGPARIWWYDASGGATGNNKWALILLGDGELDPCTPCVAGGGGPAGGGSGGSGGGGSGGNCYACINGDTYIRQGGGSTGYYWDFFLAGCNNNFLTPMSQGGFNLDECADGSGGGFPPIPPPGVDCYKSCTQGCPPGDGMCLYNCYVSCFGRCPPGTVYDPVTGNCFVPGVGSLPGPGPGRQAPLSGSGPALLSPSGGCVGCGGAAVTSAPVKAGGCSGGCGCGGSCGGGGQTLLAAPIAGGAPSSIPADMLMYALAQDAAPALPNNLITAGTSVNSISASQNDYAPPLANSVIVNTTGAGPSYNVTGLNVGQTDGMLVTIWKISGTPTLILTHQDALSAAANRFFFPAGANLTIGTGQCATFRYVNDGSNSYWRFVSKNF